MAIVITAFNASGQVGDVIERRHEVTLPEAHVGDLEIDTRLLDSFEKPDKDTRQFYLDARAVFSKLKDADFTHPEIIKAAQKQGLALMGGPLLGQLSESGAVLWVRPSGAIPLQVKVAAVDGSGVKTYRSGPLQPGKEQRIVLDNLSGGSGYTYAVYAGTQKVGEGRFKTAPSAEDEGLFRVAFGSCFHKIGLHNPNLINRIIEREPQVMMLLGDLAVDDREDNIGMHRSDYLLRDASKAWQRLAANVPLYAAWDDHDFLNNDLSGIPERFTAADREALRAVWQQNWNNPKSHGEGIYFSTRTGPVELIMLDTRSCRTVTERGEYGSYLGLEQQEWLKKTLKNSTAPYKIISSGTMWSDYVTNGKDSWGTWDTLAR
ncbi:MAG: alkaline phosphatase D family protein, partial [Bacteroidota bacterium]